MNVFNSLGSNYSFQDVLRSLFSSGSQKNTTELIEKLGIYFNGQVTLTYKGREALEIALRNCNLNSGSGVGINGFTCFVVYQAIINAGFVPVFIDVEPKQLNFGLDELKKSFENNQNIKAIIIQNTLGYPVDMPNIKEFCKNQDIKIIEDLAHSIGAKYHDGQTVGTIGDFTMLSFSQDKPLDVVAGGAVVDRRTEVTENPSEPLISNGQRLINRLYPFWTGLIRGLYPIGLGRLLHAILKGLNLLAKPMNDNLNGIHSMDKSTAMRLTKKWLSFNDELNHRKLISIIYAQQISSKLQPFTIFGEPSYLRFAIWVNDRQNLVSYLKNKGIHIADTWYDAPIAPKRYLERTDYKTGNCPNAEELANHIVNLPTHRHISELMAAEIASYVNNFHKLESIEHE